MQISFTFYGPCSDELANSGLVDFDPHGNDVVVVGKGITRALAANAAVAEFADTFFSEYLQNVSDYINSRLNPTALEVEADGTTHNVFCVIRFTE